MKKYLEAGKIVALHGVRGDVRCQSYCDTAEFFCEIAEECGLYLGKNGETFLEITRAVPHKNVVIVSVNGIDTAEKAQKLVGKTLYLDRDDVECEDGVYFIQDLIGLTAKNAETGEVYGKISEVYQNGAKDVFEIKTGGKALLFPRIDEVVKKIDTENGEILIIPLPGLFDDE